MGDIDCSRGLVRMYMTLNTDLGHALSKYNIFLTSLKNWCFLEINYAIAMCLSSIKEDPLLKPTPTSDTSHLKAMPSFP